MGEVFRQTTTSPTPADDSCLIHGGTMTCLLAIGCWWLLSWLLLAVGDTDGIQSTTLSPRSTLIDGSTDTVTRPASESTLRKTYDQSAGLRPLSCAADPFSAGGSKIRLASRLESARRRKFGWRRRQHFPAAARLESAAPLSQHTNKR